MSDKYFVDTNILMYAHDRQAGPRHVRAKAVVEDLWATRAGVLSTQVLQELCVNIRRKARQPMSTDETRALVSDYLSWEVIVNAPDAILDALDLEARYQLSLWDALIVHAAQTAGAAVLYSEDLSDGQVYGSVRVVNPFRTSASP